MPEDKTGMKKELKDFLDYAANLKNISNIISICRSANFSDDQIIQQLVEKADMTHSEAAKFLAESKI